jgi:leucine dehydrogenase
MAAVDMPFGGGKAVLAVPELLDGEARRGLLLRYADLVASLRGTFNTGPDVNTSAADMDVIGERCGYVFCRTEEHGGSGNPGPHTARGVFHGIRASVRHVFGTDSLEGRSVLVQGLGSVGAPLAEELAAAGARVLVSDVVPKRVAGTELVPAEEVIGTECDVYAPCALGGTLNAETIPHLRCRIVAGSANNQLAEPEDAERIRQAGILYAPDFVINAGGVLNSLGTEHLGWPREQIAERLAGIGGTLEEIYSKADAEAITTEAAAEQLAKSRLREAYAAVNVVRSTYTPGPEGSGISAPSSASRRDGTRLRGASPAPLPPACRRSRHSRADQETRPSSSRDLSPR